MTVVIKIGGAVAPLATTSNELADAWGKRPAGQAWIVVHGAGPQLDAALLQVSGPAIKVDGLRVTDLAAATTVREVMDQVGARLARDLRDRGVPAIHMPAVLRLFAAHAKDAARLSRVGTVDAFAADILGTCIPADTIAVVTPVAWDQEGPLNVNADEGAAAVARGVGAQRLVMATDVDSVHDALGQPIVRMNPTSARAFLASAAAQGGMRPKVQAALDVLEHGVREVRIGRVRCAWQDAGTCLAPQ